METDALHGLTAAYALNALDRREETEYEAHLARCPECQRELASLRATAASLAFATEAPAPPATLRERILNQARSERGNVVPLRPRWVLPAVGAAAAAAASVAIALGFWVASLSSALDEERQARASQARAAAVLAAEGATRIPLAGASGALVVAPTGEAALVVSDLDAAPEEKVYEAWVIEAGTPRPAGTFEGGGQRTVIALTRPVPEGATVAVTVEDEPGGQKPEGSLLFQARTA